MSHKFTEEDLEIGKHLKDQNITNILMVINKSDLVSKEEITKLFTGFLTSHPNSNVISISTQTGKNLENLENRLLEIVLGESMADGEVKFDSVVVANVRHRQALEGAFESLLESEKTTKLGLPGDFIAIDIRGALDYLGQITGETVNEEIIHRIFHDFCVGK